jgi:hypothetical protein
LLAPAVEGAASDIANRPSFQSFVDAAWLAAFAIDSRERPCIV